MTRKVAVIGSTSFPLTTAIGAQVVDAIRGYEDAALLTRGSGPFEAFVANVAIAIGLRCFAFKGSGIDNWKRDRELATAADEVLAFLDPDQLENEKSGTAHVLELALAAGKPVRAATVVDGTLVWA